MKYAFEWQTQAEFYHTDQAGVVHFAHFFTWMESAEHAFLRKLDIAVFEMTPHGAIGWPRTHVACTFYHPLYLHERLYVALKAPQLKGSFVDYQFDFFKAQGESRLHIASGQAQSCYAKLQALCPIEKIPLTPTIAHRITQIGL